jgi:poly(ADP-ribose) glycohydrolase ARH3
MIRVPGFDLARIGQSYPLTFGTLDDQGESKMTQATRLRDKFLGGMVGTGLGDAIGEMAFHFRNRAELQACIALAEQLRYTDDTAMAIGLAESLVQAGGLDEQHLGNTFHDHYLREPWRGYASGPPSIFGRVQREGMTYSEAARSLFGGQGSFGNGAAMRIAPVGLFFYDAPDLYDRARRSAHVTHAHPVGFDGAAVLARAIAWVMQRDPQETFPAQVFCQELVEFARTPEMRDKMQLVHTLLTQDTTPLASARHLGQSVAVHESLPFALYAFLRHPTSFEDCLFCASLHGGDRDTLGAMACAVSGAYLGIDAIPPEWRAKLENRPQIEELAVQLVETRARTGSTTV